MRGTPAFATLIMGLPVAAFVTTWLVTDGAPLRAPGHDRAAPALAAPQPASMPEAQLPAVPPPAEATPGVVSVAGHAGTSVAGENAPTADEWDRLVNRAAQGDRDALLFLTLMGMNERHPLGSRPSP